MSKTVESFREALEQEISKWNGFARALRRDDRESFGRLIDMARNYVVDGSNAKPTIIFEPMAMSIILSQDKRIRQLEKTLNAIRPPQNTSLKEEKPVELIVTHQTPVPKKVQRGLGDYG